MTIQLKAIETVYNGYRFRSRLEARWAVFFDSLGIVYRYEAEGYDLGQAGYYLPDFFLPDYKMFVEVKPDSNISLVEKTKASQLVLQSGNRLLMVFDCLETEKPDLYYQHEPSQFNNYTTIDTVSLSLMACCNCNSLGGFLYDYGWVDQFKEHCGGPLENSWKNLEPALPVKNWEWHLHKDLKKAFAIAQQARFEFGQTPKPGR